MVRYACLCPFPFPVVAGIGRRAKFWYAFITERLATLTGAAAACEANIAAGVPPPVARATAAPIVAPRTPAIPLEPVKSAVLTIKGANTELPITQTASSTQYPSIMAPVPKPLAPRLFVGLTANSIKARVSKSQIAQARGHNVTATKKQKKRVAVPTSRGIMSIPRKIGETAISIV